MNSFVNEAYRYLTAKVEELSQNDVGTLTFGVSGKNPSEESLLAIEQLTEKLERGGYDVDVEFLLSRKNGFVKAKIKIRYGTYAT